MVLLTLTQIAVFLHLPHHLVQAHPVAPAIHPVTHQAVLRLTHHQTVLVTLHLLHLAQVQAVLRLTVLVVAPQVHPQVVQVAHRVAHPQTHLYWKQLLLHQWGQDKRLTL
jgi:hypothetical protein